MAKINGTAGDDTRAGTDGRDTITGRGGNDVLVGNLGNDRIDGGDGFDLLIGDERDAYFSSGDDRLSGGDGNDLLSGGAGDDVLLGGAGDDILFGGTVAGARLVDGVRFETQLFTAGAGRDTFDGGEGDDQAFLAFDENVGPIEVDASDPDAIAEISEAGASIGSLTSIESIIFYGTAGDDRVVGASGDDVIYGNAGDDRLAGGTGDDWLEGGAGDDVLDGGDGSDLVRAVYSGEALDIAFDLSVAGRQSTGFGRDVLTSIERLFVANSSGGATTLTGNDAVNDLRTDSMGDITLDGRDGDDRLTGYVIGGDGTAEMRLAGGGGADNLFSAVTEGGARRITLSGGGGADVMTSQVSVGAATAISQSGGAGDDRISTNGLGRYLDSVKIAAGSGNDTVTVSAVGEAAINAGTGDDIVTIDPRRGEYKVTLGRGVDVLGLSAPSGGITEAAITVRDFATGKDGDRLSLQSWIGGGGLTGLAFGANPFLDGHLRFLQSGDDAILQFDRDGGGDDWQTLITFADTEASTFTRENVGGYALVAGVMQTGGDGDERFVGGEGDDVLSGAGGDDRLTGAGGYDILYGDLATALPETAGDDILRGGYGSDILIGGRGDDQLSGDAGDDVIVGGVATGARLLSSGTFSYIADPTVDAGGDRIDGGEGNDRAILDFKRNVAIRFDGSDRDAVAEIRAGREVIGSVVNVERFVIRTEYGTGDDRIITGAGDDIVYTGAGNDRIVAGDGTDLLGGGRGDDLLDGGGGSDVVFYNADAQATSIDLQRQGEAQIVGDRGSDTLISIEGVSVNSFGQSVTITGDANANRLDISRGAESGEAGNATIAGGEGDDVLDVSTSNAAAEIAAIVDVDGGAGDDTISVHYDALLASDRDTLVVSGGDGDDVVTTVNTGLAAIDAGSGADQVNIYLSPNDMRVTLGDGVDRLTLLAQPGDPIARDALHVTDFAAGSGGDVLAVSSFLFSAATGYAGGSNPFQTGYLRLRQAGEDTQLLFDRDGGGDGFTVLMTFEDATAAAFVAENFAGFMPGGAARAGFPTIASSATDALSDLPGPLPVEMPVALAIWP